jgi:hypothetical protein
MAIASATPSLSYVKRAFVMSRTGVYGVFQAEAKRGGIGAVD